MMPLSVISSFYPQALADDARFQKYILKEYVQLLILNFLSGTAYIRQLTFIGGTNLRLVKGIDRFSEDLDFDCKDFSKEKFEQMSQDVLSFLVKSGFRAVLREQESNRLTAFRRSLLFPELLFELGLSGHKDERFMVKLEAQDQGISYAKDLSLIKGCGLVFSFPVPVDAVLCAMKLSALLSRAKGRDFYDALFLLGQTTPDYEFLTVKCGISNLQELKAALNKKLESVNLQQKKKDFEHLLFNQANSDQILHFENFIQTL